MNLILCAVAAACLDLCVLALVLFAYRERSLGAKRWDRITSFMELADANACYELGCDEILVGRHASADIRIPDLSVSRYHAILTVSGGVWTISDIGSKSGTFVNGVRVTEAKLRENDIVKLGNRQLVFRRRRDINVR